MNFNVVYENIQDIAKKNTLILTLMLAFLISVLTYWNHISSGISLLMSVSDGFGQVWPRMSSFATIIRNDGLFYQWNFNVGLGSSQSLTLNPFVLFPALFGRDLIPYIWVWLQISRILLACLFFYLFLHKINLHPFACSMVAIMYAFSAHMIFRGGNFFIYGSEVVMVAFLLYAVELYFKDGKWKLVPVAVFLIGILTVHLLYLYTLLLFGYATVRFMLRSKIRCIDYFKYMLGCAVPYMLGVLMAGIIWVVQFVLMLNSYRGEATIGRVDMLNFLSNMFDFTDFPLFLTVVASSFSIEVLGFAGGGQINRPTHYAGVIVFLLIPLFMYYASRKLKFAAFFALLLFILYYVSPSFANLLNAFVSPRHFKISTLWITIIMLVMAGYALSEAIKQPVRTKTYETTVTIIVITWIGLIISFLGAMFLLVAQFGGSFVPFIIFVVVLLISLYALFLILHQKYSLRYVLPVLILLISFEAIWMSRLSVNNLHRQAVQIVNLLGGLELSKRYDALVHLENIDPSFYRVDGMAIRSVSRSPHWFPLSYTVTFPMSQNFNGSSFHDATMNRAYLNFLISVNGHFDPNYIHIRAASLGLYRRPMLQTLTAHKYYVAYNPVSRPAYGFSYLFTLNNHRVYKNNHYLPIGFAYDSFVSRAQFDELSSTLQKDLLLLGAAVLDEVQQNLPIFDLNEILQLAEFNPNELCEDEEGMINKLYAQFASARRIESFVMESFSQNRITGTIETFGNRMLFFSIPNAPGWSMYINGERTPIETVNIGFIGAMVGEGFHHVELVFRLPGLVAGGIMSSIGLVMYVLFIILDKKGKEVFPAA